MDIQFAVKEICRKMTKPEMDDWPAIKRLARYLKGSSRVIILFEFQDNQNFIDVWTDTDFAGCTKTRKSRSGGVIMIGKHCIKTWSKTQDTIAPSSGEAEYYGIVRGG